MSLQRCHGCGTESSGSYCPECGSSLRSAPCGSCGESPPPGARYCTHCGARVGGGRYFGLLIVAIGAAAVLALALILVLPGSDNVSVDGAAAPGTDPGNTASDAAVPAERSPPRLTGTPREQADRLFTRIMETAERGDTAEAEFFVPMALEAYRAAGDLDVDGLYHLSVVQEFAGDYSAARQSAGRILEASPRHLLGLGAAARAAEFAGDEDDARDLYARYLEAADQESEWPVPEYAMHSAMLPTYRARAEAFLSR